MVIPVKVGNFLSSPLSAHTQDFLLCLDVTNLAFTYCYCICVHICMCVHACLCMCMYVSVHVCVREGAAVEPGWSSATART